MNVIPVGQYGMPGMEAPSQEVVGFGLHSICRDHLFSSLSPLELPDLSLLSLWISKGMQEPSLKR